MIPLNETIVVFSLSRLQAETIRELAWGRDESEVKMSGRTASIGLEDRQVYSSVADPIGFGKLRLLHAVPAFSEQERTIKLVLLFLFAKW
jgi:hypothetical protein